MRVNAFNKLETKTKLRTGEELALGWLVDVVGDLGPQRTLGTPGDPPEELEEVAEEQEAWVYLLRLLPP